MRRGSRSTSTTMLKERLLNKRVLLDAVYSQSGFLIILIIVLSLTAGLLNPNFLQLKNFRNIIQQNVSLGIVSVGVGLVLITGNIEISVGSMISFMGIILSMLVVQTENILLAVTVTILIGFALGIINGTIVAKSKVASFIISLGMLLVYRGAALVITHGYHFPLEGRFTWIGRENLGGVFPVPILMFILVFIFAFFLLRFTKYGRMLYAIGGNEKSAYLSGINVDLYKILNYGLCGALTGFATLILISRLGVAYSNTGERYALDSLAAVVVGGTSLYGGKGSALGLLLGVIVFGLITNILNLVHVDPYWRDVVVGIIIVIAVIIGRLGAARE